MGAYGGSEWTMVDIDDYVADLPDKITLLQNYPNPFNATTAITFALPYESHTNLTVYDILGRRVETLIDQVLPAGRHYIQWDSGKNMSGTYFYVLRACDSKKMNKMVLLK
jgi:hypothetical protein